MDIEDSVAIVSGGASGLGEATVRLLLARGAKVVLADLDTSKGEALAEEFAGQAHFLKTDVSDHGAVQRAVGAAQSLGSLRVAVACAGVAWAAKTVSREGAPHDPALFGQVLAVNLIGTFNLLSLAAAAMADEPAAPSGQRGVIITTASVAAFEGQIGQLAYAASKAGVAGLTLPAARDLASIGVRVVTIAPGLFETPMMAGLPAAARDALPKTVVNPKRLGAPSEYAALVGHIIENEYLNGETIRLDGALRMAPK